MANSNPKSKPPPPEGSTSVLKVVSTGDKPEAAQIARLAIDGITSNAITARTFAFAQFGELDVTECVASLRQCAERVNGGDLKYLESTLTAQAVNLDAIFNGLAKRAALNMGEHLDATERYMRLALKAQSQCRATLETLAAIKNPPVVFARQANITSGPQQVNNCAAPLSVTSTRTGAHAGKIDSVKNELLEDQQHDNMVGGATRSTGRIDSDVATVGALHRPTNG